MAGFSFSALCKAPMAALSKTACTASGSRWVVTRLKASAAALSHGLSDTPTKNYIWPGHLPSGAQWHLD